MSSISAYFATVARSTSGLRDLRSGHSLTVQTPDILLFGHRYCHRPFLPERRRLQPADSFFFGGGLRLGDIQARRAGACFRLDGRTVQFLLETDSLCCGKTVQKLLKKN